MKRLADIQPGEYRDCVVDLVMNGPRSSRVDDQLSCIHWITAELRARGWTAGLVKDLVRAQNSTWQYPIPKGKLKKRISYIDWAFSRDRLPISCKPKTQTPSHDQLCDRLQTQCLYFERNRNIWNSLVAQGKVQVFSNTSWPEYLRYNYRRTGPLTIEVMLALDRLRQRRNLPPEAEIFAGLREIAAEINTRRDMSTSPRAVAAAVRILEDEELLAVRRGKSGSKTREANAYTYPLIFPLPPAGPSTPHTHSGRYCVPPTREHGRPKVMKSEPAQPASSRTAPEAKSSQDFLATLSRLAGYRTNADGHLIDMKGHIVLRGQPKQSETAIPEDLEP